MTTCKATTATTRYFVSGSGPQSLVTSGCALIIACRRVRCGSSVYVQKKSSVFFVVSVMLGCGLECSLRETKVDVVTEEDMADYGKRTTIGTEWKVYVVSSVELLLSKEL